jgi:hypothetical protein
MKREIFMISNFKNLYVGEFCDHSDKMVKVVLCDSNNFAPNGVVFSPFAYDLKSNSSILVSNSNHLKPLRHYINFLGLPKKKIPTLEKEKQQEVLAEVKELKHLRRI